MKIASAFLPHRAGFKASSPLPACDSPEALFRFLGRILSELLHVLHSGPYNIIPVVPIVQRPVHPADRRGRSAGLLRNVKVGMLLPKHPRNFKSLRKRENLIDCAHILEEVIAFLPVLKTQNRIKQTVNFFSVECFINMLRSLFLFCCELLLNEVL